MKSRKIKSFGIILTTILSTLSFIPTYASAWLGISPMKNKIILNAGENYNGSFSIINQSDSDQELYYHVDVVPFYVNENYNNIFDEYIDDYNQIVNWIKIDKQDGIVLPHSTINIDYEINVPVDAPAGGQYAAIRVTNINKETDHNNPNNANEAAVGIQEQYAVAYTILAEIAGNTRKDGEIHDALVPTFLTTGDIYGSSSIENTGNVHGTAYYKLQIFPIFSNEEVYTNEENPDTKIILPNRTLYNQTVWDETPPIGIFNVIYTVEFEGVTTQVPKLVIICPIWLLFIIIFVIFALIFYFIAKAKARKKASQKTSRS